MIYPYFFCELCDVKHALVEVVDCKHGKDQLSWDNYNEFNKCPACSGSHFYRQKDFNRLLGCGIILFGILLVPITYGISLAIVALVDWFLYNRVPDTIVCYKCKGEFFGIHSIPKNITSFDHHIAELYEEPS